MTNLEIIVIKELTHLEQEDKAKKISFFKRMLPQKTLDEITQKVNEIEARDAFDLEQYNLEKQNYAY